MKFGLRKPSLKKSLSARFSIKRKIKNSLGLRMPRGTGWITNPKRYVYNKVYNKTTFGLGDLFKTNKKTRQTNGNNSSICTILIGLFLLIILPPVGIAIIIYYFLQKKKSRNQENQTEQKVVSSYTDIEDNSPNLNLAEWFEKEFTKEEQNHMEEMYQPLGASSGLKNGLSKLTEKSASFHLSSLSSWFDNPRDRTLAFKLINKAEEYVEKGDTLDQHFFWAAKMGLYYKLRDIDPKALDIAIQSAQKQIDLSPKAAEAFLKSYSGGLPTHPGYTQLAIILDKQGKYDEAIELVKQAKSQGWNGDWDKRIERLETKKAKKQ